MGYCQEEIAGKHYSLFYSPDEQPAADLEKVQRHVQQVGAFYTERTLRRKDGSEFRASGYLGVVHQDETDEYLWVAVFNDVTEKKKTEALLQLVQAIETRGQFTAGIAHEFNNLFATIQVNLEGLKRGNNASQIPSAPLVEIAAAVRKGASLTDDLLTTARQRPLSPSPLNLNDMIVRIKSRLLDSSPELVRFRFELDPNLWMTVVDADLLENAIFHIVNNAKDALGQSGELEIRTENHWFRDEYTAAFIDLAPGQYVSLSISDNGAGMDEKVLERACEAFFTTKGHAEHRGLGLSVVQGFAKQSDGHVNLYSEPGQGTTVRLYLPRSTLADKVATQFIDFGVSDFHRETILVIDDNIAVRTLLINYLGGQGFRVLEAGSGAAAFQILESWPNIDLILCDVFLGRGVIGTEFVEKVRETQPHIRSVFMSGYPEMLVTGRAQLPSLSNFLAKPFQLVDLDRIISRALSSSKDETSASP